MISAAGDEGNAIQNQLHKNTVSLGAGLAAQSLSAPFLDNTNMSLLEEEEEEEEKFSCSQELWVKVRSCCVANLFSMHLLICIS
jgi:hypothetical protein